MKTFTTWTRLDFIGGFETVKYYSQSKKWMNTVIFNDFIKNIFIPYIQSKGKKKVLLFVDNFSVHQLSEDYESQGVYVYKLPPNCTAKHQPLDGGIIKNLKVNYRTQIIKLILDKYNLTKEFFNVKDISLLNCACF